MGQYLGRYCTWIVKKLVFLAMRRINTSLVPSIYMPLIANSVLPITAMSYHQMILQIYLPILLRILHRNSALKSIRKTLLLFLNLLFISLLAPTDNFEARDGSDRVAAG
ncbi:hypothetical protein K449DRAFT_194884 [Hypoxylon sp. EC38]|nr:hypothetical protein K449DRAFT_194884 [Hypoxylon sp. EC38]